MVCGKSMDISQVKSLHLQEDVGIIRKPCIYIIYNVLNKDKNKSIEV